jgi:hypothetical protein
MSSLTLDVSQWAEQQFGTCELGDVRRTKRLIRLATQIATKPDRPAAGGGADELVGRSSTAPEKAQTDSHGARFLPRLGEPRRFPRS